MGLMFLTQRTNLAGPGAWVTGCSALVALLISALSIVRGERRITRLDLLTFFAALAMISVWYFTSDPLWLVILITEIDMLGFYPTFRKSYVRPHEESAVLFALSATKFVFSYLALSTYSIVTALYPLTMVILCAALVALLLWRRAVVPAPGSAPI
jgi:uncharacterized membrane protein SpoIIM required for sporulation